MDQTPACEGPLFTVRNFAERHRKWLTQPGLRAHILNSTDRQNSRGETLRGNGLVACGAIVRIGRRILIDEAAFFRWIADQQKRATRQ